MRETTPTALGGNRLSYEKSPYLRQHAQDPVHWLPWCPGAFHRAITEDKPIFLSIGYSTCHWCHVMGRETFQDPEVARMLNRGFVSVKVDREERPDVDAVYMEACQLLTGSGGWPLTILMTPDQKPFWAGTYLPPRSQGGGLGLVELLDEVERLWQSDRERLLELGCRVAGQVARQERVHAAVPDRALLLEAAGQLRRRFDRENGGFGGAPKFPSPYQLLFLLELARREGDREALEMAEVTLRQMARGGIFDQLGGGFCRYSTDRRWHMPHFEKMLYDNALLACAYLEAYAQTGRPFYREVACRTLDYAIEELGLPGGGFACGQDADSEGQEGRFYLLTAADVREALGAAEAAAFCRRYGIGEGDSVPHLLEDEDRIREEMKAAKRESDIVLVFVHWGTEYEEEPDDFQKKWTQLFLDSGVDVTVGTHPHALQPYEMLEGSDGHRMLVYYSIGNYISAQSEKSCVKGGMADFTVSLTTDGYRITEYGLRPLVIKWEEGRKCVVDFEISAE